MRLPVDPETCINKIQDPEKTKKAKKKKKSMISLHRSRPCMHSLYPLPKYWRHYTPKHNTLLQPFLSLSLISHVKRDGPVLTLLGWLAGQVLCRSAFKHLSSLQSQTPIRVLDSLEPVRNGNHRAIG